MSLESKFVLIMEALVCQLKEFEIRYKDLKSMRVG